MTTQDIYGWWFVWLAVSGVIVVAAATLLITIIVLARRISALAGTALAVAEQIEQNTKPIWQLNATNKVAKDLLAGATALEGNAGAIVKALAEADRRMAA